MGDYRRLLKYLRPHLFLFIAAMLAMLLTALFETATGALLVPLLNQFQEVDANPSSTLFLLHKLIPLKPWFQAWLTISALLVLFTFLKGVGSYVSAYLMARIGQSAVLALREELYSHLLAQSASFYGKHRTNFLVSRLVTSCAAIELAVSANVRDVLRETCMLFFFIGAAFFYNWRLMLGALVLGPIIGMLTSRFSRALRKLADVSIKGNQKLTDTAQETLSNSTIVKAYSAEDHEKSRFSKVARMIAEANLSAGRISALSPPLIELIGVLAMVVFFYFGLREINLGNMDAAQFFAFLFFLFRSYDPMRKISRQHNEITKAFAAARDVWDVLDEDDRIPIDPDPVSVSRLSDCVKFEDVSFGYGLEGVSVLKNISVEIKKGETVALVGESGGGKSSLVKLIQRLYDPTEGSILWDGTDLRRLEPSSFRKQFALVSQETVLFNESIRYNIAYGNPSASDKEIAEAAKVAFADGFIEELPDRYETLVGERGVLLSGGQRQRIAIARAVLANAPFLILDEATSALDTESERFVQLALENLMRGRTSVVIAHRLSTIRKADRIYVIDKGKIAESGNHEELLSAGGIYRKLYDLQFSEQEPIAE
ncbi:MAG: ABC transporter ATP-binding protein [Pyrinomonadaceae bacterium]